jgi:hypothetical protein
VVPINQIELPTVIIVKKETTFMGLLPTFFAATPNFFSRSWAVHFQKSAIRIQIARFLPKSSQAEKALFKFE